MPIKQISVGTVHELPKDLREALASDKSALERWENLTPLARNEWICWCITNKRAETRRTHVERTVTELLGGKRRPCCWLGCIHRPDKPVSPSVRAILNKKTKKE